ncbi:MULTISPECIES: PQQ-dependent sugar dehydrogenase [unclassified Luteimonas]|uniref:PQQ-dependent sugar dehydrogenase n=1 Tax=unclassified Luteimonas TaxID=2629088 RepID=UPI0016030F0E|nr:MULTISPECIES: PQQ-dependent sugar dehydrogenase [unclassified Luteimonas]MBB1473589.1 PQQ-dependent sugar dehydrogenase [Luteimonas sp. MC1782]MBB6600196.1 PQQ-dependent sugar dehydrogenase [Luteimonas sp. MC1825]QOC87885.1 PQQ-dependent sugar dehydrogenase [Luteimonas sp. MC1825]
MNRLVLTAACALALAGAACHRDGEARAPGAGTVDGAASSPADAATDASRADAEARPFAVDVIAKFDEPWAMAFLPDGRLLVTEKKGALRLVDVQSGASTAITGVPEVAYGGQGGLGDVLPHPRFSDNGLVYLSYAEPGRGDERGAAVARARLVADADGGRLEDLKVIWRQVPKVSGNGHYGHRLLFGADGKLWISSSERQAFDPAQDMASNLGKIIRLEDDGSVPADNPFAAQGGVAAQVWSLGHRNVLGIDFDAQGRLWNTEMGPKGGDELNLVERGANYGYPVVSNGDHYDGRDIPDHDTRPEFKAPAISWSPVISPSSLLFYSGSAFPAWQGSAFIGGLSSQSLVRVAFEGDSAREAERFDMGARIRAVEQGPEGALWLLEDGGRDGSLGRLLKLEAAGD